MPLYDPDPDWETVAEQRAESERDWFNPFACSDPPEESCSDAACPVHSGEVPFGWNETPLY